MQDFVREISKAFDRDAIKCTRNDHDGDNDRVRAALNIAYGYAIAKVGRIIADREFHCLYSIHDHKGELTVYYNFKLSPLLVEAMEEAWEACCEPEIRFVPATL